MREWGCHGPGRHIEARSFWNGVPTSRILPDSAQHRFLGAMFFVTVIPRLVLHIVLDRVIQENRITHVNWYLQQLIHNPCPYVADFEPHTWLLKNVLILGSCLGMQVPQVGGYTERYTGLTFATVQGAGHFAAADKPGQVLDMVSRFVLNHPLWGLVGLVCKFCYYNLSSIAFFVAAKTSAPDQYSPFPLLSASLGSRGMSTPMICSLAWVHRVCLATKYPSWKRKPAVCMYVWELGHLFDIHLSFGHTVTFGETCLVPNMWY